MTTTAIEAARYCELGFYLVTIPPGTKGPTSQGWNTVELAINDPMKAYNFWKSNPKHNVGLLHSASQTVAIDIDQLEWSRLIFSEMGLDYDEIMDKAPRIKSREGRDKAIFRAPRGIELSAKKLNWDNPKFNPSLPVSKDNPKYKAVFELRGGTVQDVLPPSIHPDTGKPYEWAGPSVFNGIPELPESVLHMWLHWDKFEPQLVAMCPWRVAKEPKFTPPRKPRPAGDRASVIEGYNNAHTIEECLERYGYRRVGRSGRWISPNSSSRLAGVNVFDDNRAFSHHASDPFDSSHTFDPFDMFCQYEHGGDVARAVKAAAEYLGMVSDAPTYDEEAINHGAAVAASILPSRAKKVDRGPLSGVPEHLLSIPGVLQDAVNSFNTSSVMKQPQFAVVAALALGCTVMGRRWKTSYNNYSNAYFISIGDTGCGKEYIRKFVNKSLSDCGLERLIGKSGYTSGSGVISELVSKPTHITVIDEMGRKLKQAAGRDNSNAQSMLTSLMEVFGMQDGVLTPQGYASMGLKDDQKAALERVVRHPSLTVVGMSTVHDFVDSISHGDVASGFLNRFIIVETDIGVPRPEKSRSLPLSERLKDWCIASASASTGGLIADVDSHDLPPDAVTLDFSAGAEVFLDTLTDEIHAYRTKHKDSPLSAMKSRTREIAMRLSLVVANSCGEDEISEGSLRWAYDFVNFYTDRIITRMEKSMSVNDFHDVCNKVLEAIIESGLRGVSDAELAKNVAQFKGLKDRDRQEVMRVLIADSGIGKTMRTGRGRPVAVWIANNSDEGENND